MTIALIGAEYSSYIHALEGLGITAIKVPRNPDISRNIAYHADMSIFHAGSDEFFITKSNTKLMDIMHKYTNNIHIIEKCGPKYPDDVRTNACLAGNILLCSEKGTSRHMIEFAESRGCRIVFVNQGYVKCSVCILNENTIITDDRSIERAAERNGLNVFRYDGNDVVLTGYDRGFIGGTCGKISSDEIVFTGRFKTDEIERFANNAGISVKYLSDGAPYDVGSIIPIKELAE
ncbi:MAG: hypothetical protein J6P71_01600 [Oscillospiraceae bacterium]|nr:hypothetical protein [Oscillospiraceae bacterium]